MNLNKELKRKRDAEKRLDRVSPVKVVVINGGGMGDVDLSKYLTAAVEKLNGLQGDVIIKAGDNIEIDIDGNEIEISGIGGPGGITEIPQATEYMLGGIKARERLDETNEVKIDSETGKLYTKALTGEGGTDAESILTKEVSVADFSGKDGYILAYDEAQDVFYLKKDDGGEGGGIGGLEVVGLIKMFAQRAVDFMPLVNSGFASPEEG